MGSYVTAEIQGRTLSSVFPVKRIHLRGENDEVWIMDEKERLEIRPVRVIFSDVDQVYVSEGLTEEEKLVITDIAAPMEGMRLRAASSEGQRSEPREQAPGQDGGQR